MQHLIPGGHWGVQRKKNGRDMSISHHQGDRPGGAIALPGGAAVGRLGIGCWPIGGPAHNLGMPMGWSTATDTEARQGLERAYELGANLFDTADVYGLGHSERLLGNLLAAVPRRSVAVCSKVGYFTGTAKSPYTAGHMRRQLEQSLENLGTTYLDVYALHNGNFGPGDRDLPEAVEAMRAFQTEGLVRAVGMRGPHRYAPERLAGAPGSREDKHARFRRQFAQVRPDVLAVRDNLLTPPEATAGIRQFAAEHQVTVLVNKPLAQGLLTGKHHPGAAPRYGLGDHRRRKAWFTAPALEVLQSHLKPVRDRFGPDTVLGQLALHYLLARWQNSAVVVGFTTTSQVEENLTPLQRPLTDADLACLAEAGSTAQQALDALGEVFTDETTAASATPRRAGAAHEAPTTES
nr:aldo/keto reductase [Streptomyces sp. NBC_00899]